MSERAPSFEPRTELTGRELAIAAMGGSGFRIESGPNAYVPESEGHNTDTAEDSAIIFVESVQVKDGVTCDIYSFKGDDTMDLGAVTVQKGFKTPLQKVLGGTKTLEVFHKGVGILTVTRQSGETELFTFPNIGDQDEVEVSLGDTMQWEALEDLVFLEICEPPYDEGRFQNLD